MYTGTESRKQANYENLSNFCVVGGDRAGEVWKVGWSRPGQGPERWHFSPPLSVGPASKEPSPLLSEMSSEEESAPRRGLAGVPTRASPETPSASEQKIDGQAPGFPAQPGVGRAVYFRASDWLRGKDAAGTAGLGSGGGGRRRGRKSQLGTMGASKRCSCGSRSPHTAFFSPLSSPH